MFRHGELRFDQVRALMRLVGEAKEIGALDPARPHHLIDGLNRILGAVAGGCVTDCDFSPSGRGAFTAVVLAGWDETTLPALAVLGEAGSAFNPGIRALMKTCPPSVGATVTAGRPELVSDGDWYRSPYVDGHLRPTGLDHAIYSSARGAAPSVVQGLGFYREKSDRPFDDADRALVHLFHLECSRLLEAPAQAIDGVLKTRLPPRQRQVLELLLDGLADKEIAERLAISPYTVNQYTKALYRRFGVTSRASLVARLIGRAPP